MSIQTQDNTYIIGHKNPDADAICSAIAYAELKKQQGHKGFIPARCGNTNARIDTILNKFNQPLPIFLGDLSPTVSDIMVRNVVKIKEGATISEALELIDRHDVRSIPVTNEDNILKGYVSVFQMGDYFIPKLNEPKAMRQVNTSISNVVKALKADVKHVVKGDSVEDMFVKIGAMDIRSFGKFTGSSAIPAEQTIVVVGDRWDIQQRSIQIGVRLLVITGSLGVDPEVIEMAKDNGVSVIISPFDSATTAWTIRTASQVDKLYEREYISFGPNELLKKVSKRIANTNVPAYMVVGEDGKLVGLFSKTDILKPTRTNIILVDHNELGQAVQGAADVNITEIIDHHRLGNVGTQQPILFINDPVGSTCTIIADLFRRSEIDPTPEIAGIMMSGIISDTLNLTGPTTTPRDGEILAWLEGISGVTANDLAHEIFSSGSIIISMTPDEVIRADQKIYQEGDFKYSVSQIEELGFNNFWDKVDELSAALNDFRVAEELTFACVLVTDINKHNSLLVVSGDEDFIDAITYPAVEKGRIYELKGVVSRKKQLIPFITSTIKSVDLKD
ncbi:putative manganese-dependent inorganic diphosphatase [Puniceicoccaceae bacterium K14]|nr:putative manganese-dependent inorganic diphosphatase [Puniceicoccaceae bacterium K14]